MSGKRKKTEECQNLPSSYGSSTQGEPLDPLKTFSASTELDGGSQRED